MAGLLARLIAKAIVREEGQATANLIGFIALAFVVLLFAGLVSGAIITFGSNMDTFQALHPTHP